MSPPRKQGGKQFAPIRPLLNQPPLNIETLPTRIQNGECNVLPPKFNPPQTCMPPCTACPPAPCTPYCVQPCMPNCYYPPPCTAFPPVCPQPPPMCCPPPCPPVLVCPPNYCSPYPCMPPQNCCPPPPCPPPPCVPKCCTKSPGCCPGKTSCCGGKTSSCCRGPKQIVCLPKGTKPIVGCGVSASPRPLTGNPFKRGGPDKPASYNNCNFYLTEIPKGLKGRFGLMGATSEETTDDTECTEETSSCNDVDDECEDDLNTGAGDDQVVHPPLGYPGSERVPWGGGFPGIAGDGENFGNPYGNDGRGMNSTRSGGGGTGTRGGPGTAGTRGTPWTGRGGTGTTGNRSGPGTVRGGPGTAGNRSGPGTVRSGPGTAGYRNGPGTGRGGPRDQYYTEHEGRGGTRGRTPYTGRSNAYQSQKGAGNSYGQTQRSGNGRYGTGCRTGATAKTEGYRDYIYTNDELTSKSAAYFPQAYTVPPPHTINKKVHPLRAPITPYSSHLHRNDDTQYSDRPQQTSSTYFKSGAGRTQSQFPVYTNRSQQISTNTFGHGATPSTYRSNAQSRNPSCTGTAVPSKSWRTNPRDLGTFYPSSYHPSGATSGTATARDLGTFYPSSYHPSGATSASRRPSACQIRRSMSQHQSSCWNNNSERGYDDARVGTSRSQFGTGATNSYKTGAPTQRHSEPSLRNRPGSDGAVVPVYRRTTQTQLQILERPDEPSEIRVVQRPVQEVVGYRRSEPDLRQNRIGLDVRTQDGNNGKHKRHSDDWNRLPKNCLKPHARRLHRLCSVSNKRNLRLSQVHKPQFKFRAPPCPIRETLASVLRKRPPANCKWHEQNVPAYHEYCMNDPSPGQNRYPLLTKELRENVLEQERYNSKGYNHQNGNSRVEKRGAKRKLHHR